MRARSFVLPLLAVVIFLSSCSGPLFSSLTPAVKEVLVGVSSRYLGLIAAGQERAVIELVDWNDFSDQGDFTIQEFHRQFTAIKGRWPLTPQEHPLLGLQVVEVTGGGNHGIVRLKKDPKYVTAGAAPGPEIEIRFIWAGTGWVIREDSLFGKRKYFAQFAPKTS